MAPGKDPADTHTQDCRVHGCGGPDRRVALTAEAHDHHPDIHLAFTALTLSLWSHDAGGITQKDVDLATALDPILDAAAA